MTYHFKKIALIGRQNTKNAAKTLSSLVTHLQKKKIEVVLEKDTAQILPTCKIPIVARENLRAWCELIIVVGGDGSLLSAARIAATQKLPILGVNRGHLGFLTDIAPNNIAKIDEVLNGEFYEEKRFLLAVEVHAKDVTAMANLALNDIVLHSDTTGHMIEFDVHVDNQFLCSYHADGLIIATPTGSTAHALSGGGPILHPTLEALVLVPMLSHNLSSRPIVIDSKSTIKIVFNETNKANLLVRLDGQIQTTLDNGIIKIAKAKEKLRLLHPTDYNYFETLRTKLHWERKQNTEC